MSAMTITRSSPPVPPRTTMPNMVLSCAANNDKDSSANSSGEEDDDEQQQPLGTRGVRWLDVQRQLKKKGRRYCFATRFRKMVEKEDNPELLRAVSLAIETMKKLERPLKRDEFPEPIRDDIINKILPSSWPFDLKTAMMNHAVVEYHQRDSLFARLDRLLGMSTPKTTRR